MNTVKNFKEVCALIYDILIFFIFTIILLLGIVAFFMILKYSLEVDEEHLIDAKPPTSETGDQSN